MDFDLFVIGAGSGGVRAARMSAQMGAKVAIAEVSDLGGTCVNVGCVPKKLFVYAAQFAQGFVDAREFGLDTAVPHFDWDRLRDNKDKEIARLNGIYGNLLDGAGVELMRGRATITGPNEVTVNGVSYSANRILIATGGWPFVPEIEGKEHIITSNEVFHLKTWPKRAVVIGGGYIAVEFAGIFNGTGVDTTLVHRGDKVLRGFDADTQAFAQEQFAVSGINLQMKAEVTQVTKTGDSYLVGLNTGVTLEADLVLGCTGRVPNTQGLGLESVGVLTASNGAVVVDESFATNVPSIFAVGDVIGRVALTPVALAEGMYLAHEWFGEGGRPVRYDAIPTAVFSQPNIGTVGLTEEEARKTHEVEIYRSSFRPMQNTISGNPLRAMMKLIVCKKSRKILGAHMVGPDAGEIMQGIGIAYAMGATKEDFDQTIGIHPTAAEEFVTMREPV
ncbi:glutathione-disulfide reductase [Salinispirillum sp. LH 10-3-1]|uniref:Glutathione-disulfide reductase n=1 Tax=Salinispirillum sp. LH 10-3-1 TaxID=2952525 RepID=A0AB38YCP2_9GAMM